MTERFLDPGYLRRGNDRQRAAYKVLRDFRIFETLAPYDPMLAGTIPLAIDIPGSDLDVLCEVHDFDGFAEALRRAYGDRPDFNLSHFKAGRDGPYRTASFSHGGFAVEVFGQACPVSQQRAYRHMVVEARLLELGGEPLQSAIIALKRSGLKTEPAFARCLGIHGDPYLALLALEALDDEALLRLLDDASQTHRG